MNIEDSKRRGSPNRRKSNECAMLIATITVGILFGFFIGASFPAFSPSKVLSCFDSLVSQKCYLPSHENYNNSRFRKEWFTSVSLY
nr:hypothetical protein CTI12_AA331510 [Tanacetum cinerariifolium]